VPVNLLFVRLALVRKRDLVSGFLVPVRTRFAGLVLVRTISLVMYVLADRLATLVVVALGRLQLLGFSGFLERLVRLLQVVEELMGFLCGSKPYSQTRV
jgi:hypothetical protein